MSPPALRLPLSAGARWTILALLLVLAGVLGYPPWRLAALEKEALSPDPAVSRAAVYAMSSFGSPAAVDGLCHAFRESGDAETRELARTFILLQTRMLPSYGPPRRPPPHLEPTFELEGRFLLLLDGNIEQGLRATLEAFLAARMRLPVESEASPLSFTGLPRIDGGATNAETMLDLTAQHVRGEHGRLLLVTDRELARPGRAWVAGVGHGFGAAAVVSTAGLERGAAGGDAAVASRRLFRAALQALGHTLLHTDQNCRRPGCAMFRVERVEDLDGLGDDYCPVCHTLAEAELKHLQPPGH
ncbi:MAG: hypothetical protein HYZ53_14115 [Planctomycetes bacterium]|nr:hypothetical protein [Planctomycetota bacterium]